MSFLVDFLVNHSLSGRIIFVSRTIAATSSWPRRLTIMSLDIRHYYILLSTKILLVNVMLVATAKQIKITIDHCIYIISFKTHNSESRG